jgi:hypothetical protein
VVPGYREHRRPERPEKARRALVLVATSAVREVPGRDDQLRPDMVDQRGESALDIRVLACTRVEIGYMQEAPRHDRMRL